MIAQKTDTLDVATVRGAVETFLYFLDAYVVEDVMRSDAVCKLCRMGAVGFRRRIHGRKRVNTDFEDDFVPVRMSLVVDSVRCP